MIQIQGVEQTARDLRPLKRGWGALHWYCYLPWLIPYLGLTAMMMMLIRAAPGAGYAPIGVFLTTVVLWLVANQLAHSAMIRQAAKAPSRGVAYDWTFDDTGLMQTSPLMSSSTTWQAMRDVREETDRFIVLVSPHSNPVLPKRLMTEAQIAGLRALIAEVRASGRLGRGVVHP